MYCRRHKLPWRQYSTWDESYLSHHLASVNANLPPVVTGRFKFNDAINKGIKGIIPAYTHIVARMNACATLAYQYSPGIDLLPGVSLDTKPLGLTIPT
jgi:hypothetical protein